MNKVILMGRLCTDPEIKQSNSGATYCNFKVAVDSYNGKEKQAEFFSCTAFGKTAEFIAKYFSKGKPILIDGTLHNNDYEDKNGTKHYSMNIIVNSAEFCLSSGKAEPQQTAQPTTRQQQSTEYDGVLPF